MHALQSKTARPERLFDAMVGSQLLIIGCAFADWPARFFVRIGKRERLSLARGGKTDFLAGECAQQDDELVHFLQHFSTRTKVFPWRGCRVCQRASQPMDRCAPARGQGTDTFRITSSHA